MVEPGWYSYLRVAGWTSAALALAAVLSVVLLPDTSDPANRNLEGLVVLQAGLGLLSVVFAVPAAVLAAAALVCRRPLRWSVLLPGAWGLVLTAAVLVTAVLASAS